MTKFEGTCLNYAYRWHSECLVLRVFLSVFQRNTLAFLTQRRSRNYVVTFPFVQIDEWDIYVLVQSVPPGLSTAAPLSARRHSWFRAVFVAAFRRLSSDAPRYFFSSLPVSRCFFSESRSVRNDCDLCGR